MTEKKKEKEIKNVKKNIFNKVDQMIELLQSGRTEEAMTIALKTKELAKEHKLSTQLAEAYMNIGSIHIRWGNIDEAKMSFQKGLKQKCSDSQKVMLEANLGAILLAKNDGAKAMEHTRRAYNLAPKDSTLKSQLKIQLDKITALQKCGGTHRFRQMLSVDKKKKRKRGP